MAAPAQDRDEATSTLSTLKLDDSKRSTKPSKQKPKKDVADSWEDEESEGEFLPEDKTQTPSKPPVSSASSPPSISPQHDSAPAWSSTTEPRMTSSHDGPPSRRPEKTDAVARRMIAAGLGLKAPKQTEEQRAYQRSICKQERKCREREREEQRRREEADNAKAAIWNE